MPERDGAEWLFCPKRKGTGKNLISNFIARGPDTGLRPTTQRMRAAYLVQHIEAGDSVKEPAYRRGAIVGCIGAVRAVCGLR